MSAWGRAACAVDTPTPLPPLQAPIFLVGAPRTGTTFLHRLLVELGVGRGLTLGNMLVPSSRLTRWVGPRLARLDPLGPGRFHDPSAHSTGMLEVETEDAALLFRFLDGFLAYAFFFAWAENADEFDPSDPLTTTRDLDWLDGLWRRHGGGQRTIAKAASFGLRVPALLSRYPDARFLYTVRDPCALIPSALSLVQGAATRRFPHLLRDALLQATHAARTYSSLVELLNRFATAWATDALPTDRVRLCAYTRLVGDAERELSEVLHFLGVPRASVDEAVWRRAVLGQKERKSGHRYALQRFGLTEDQVRTDCAPFYEVFSAYLPAPKVG